MNFNSFRLIIALLASLGAFFAYICRLNLSLVIVDMTKNVDLDLVYEQFDHIQNEEHALAFISRSRWRHLVSGRSEHLSPEVKITQRMPMKSSFAINHTLPLSIDIDVSNRNSKSNSDSDAPSSASNIATSPVPESNDGGLVQEASRSTVDWSEEDRNFLLGAFFVGYVVFQIPAGRAAEVIGAKPLFLIMGIGNGICSLLFPMACKFSSTIYFAYAIRFLIGAFQAGLFPAAYVLLCEWLPKSERSKWLPFPSTFGRIGTIVMNLVVPQILNCFTWEMVFYISGVCIISWSLFMLVFSSNSPDSSYWISSNELVYIESRMEPKIVDSKSQSVTIKTASGFTINETPSDQIAVKKPKIDWLKLATNKAVIVMTLVMFTSEWSNMLLLVKLPGFLEPALKMNIDEVGLWSSVLVAVYGIQYPLSGYIASSLEVAQIDGLDSLRIRKIFELSAHLMQGIGCIIIAFTSNKIIVIAALVFIMLGRATVGGGQCLMPPELSKDYPGTVFAFANSFANIAGVVGPLIVTLLVEDPKIYEDWSRLWLLSGIIFFAGGITFCLFADNRPQNYCKKPKRIEPASSEAQLTIKDEEILKMDAFSRVGSEPRDPNQKKRP